MIIIAVLSAGSGASAQSSDPGPGKVIAIVPMASPQGLAVNTTTNRIYVASDTGGSPTNGLWRIEGTTLSVTQRVSLPADRLPFGVAVNRATNRVYLTSLSRSFPYNAGSVVVLDEVSGSTTTIAVPAGVYWVATNPTTNRVYVTNNGLGSSGRVTVIKGATNTVVGSPVAVGSGPFGVAVNPTTNRIYVALPLSGLIAVINGATNTVVETIQSSGWPLEAAVNTSNKRVYVTTYSGQDVDVIDGASNAVLGGVFIGSNTLGVGVNPTTRRVYIGRTFGTDGVAVVAECALDSEGNFVCPL